MPNTYSQAYTHVVFAVKYWENMITREWRDELHQYISGIITNEGAKSLAVGGWLDHVHIFFGQPVTTSVANLVRVVKTNSSKWINEKGFVQWKFRWQEGYGAFTYALSERDTVIRYIMNQEIHHQKNSFRQEYVELLNEFEISYDEKYLFEFY